MELQNVHFSIFIVQTCIVVIGTFSNIISFIVWTKGKVCRTLPIALYFRILAAVDTFILLVPGVELLLYVSPYNLILRNVNHVTCRLYPGFTQSSIRVSSWIISSFSIERTLYVYFPTKFRVTQNSTRTLIITACLVVTSLLMDLPLFIRSELVTRITTSELTPNDTTPGVLNVTQDGIHTNTTPIDIPTIRSHFVTNTTMSTIAINSTLSNGTHGGNNSVQYNGNVQCVAFIKSVEIIIDSVTKFLLTLIILISCNILILTQFRRQHRFSFKMGSQRVNEVRQARYRNAIYQMVGISFFHCLSTAPWSVFAACRQFGCENSRFYYELLLGFNALAYLNSAINVILYCFIGNNFRRDLRYLFCTKKIEESQSTEIETVASKVQ